MLFTFVGSNPILHVLLEVFMYAPILKSFYSLGFHLGQLHDKWKPAVLNYILGFRFRLTIHTLDKTVILFRLALLFSRRINTFRFPAFFFLAKKKKEAFFYLANCSSLIYSFFWTVPGILTNFKIVSKLFRFLVKGLLFPSLLINVVVNPSLGFIREAKYLGVPLIAVVDSSVSYLEEIPYPILSSLNMTDAFLLNVFRLVFGFSFVSKPRRSYLKLKMKHRLFFSGLRVSIRKLRIKT